MFFFLTCFAILVSIQGLCGLFVAQQQIRSIAIFTRPYLSPRPPPPPPPKKKHERTQQLTSQKYARAPFLMPVAVEDCTKKIFCASCCVYVKNKCVSCYYSGIVRRHYTKPESLPVRSTFSFFFSPTVIRDPSCFDEFCLMRATPPVRLR